MPNQYNASLKTKIQYSTFQSIQYFRKLILKSTPLIPAIVILQQTWLGMK